MFSEVAVFGNYVHFVISVYI